MRFLISILFSVFFAFQAYALDIQAAIDALPPSGGVINIPCGTHPNGGIPLSLRSGVILHGEGRQCTTIPPIGPSQVRIYNVSLEDVTISNTLGSGYGLDWRNVTNGYVKNVHVTGFSYGLVMTGPTYYNIFENLTVAATNTAVELTNNSNQNTFIGGKFSAPVGIRIYNSNGNTIIGSSLEDAINDMIFKVIIGDGGSTRAVGVRQEDSNHSSTYWNQ